MYSVSQGVPSGDKDGGFRVVKRRTQQQDFTFVCLKLATTPILLLSDQIHEVVERKVNLC